MTMPAAESYWTGSSAPTRAALDQPTDSPIRRLTSASTPAPLWVCLTVSDPARTKELRDYFRRLGVTAFVEGTDTVEAQCAPGSDVRRAREEIEGYLNSWIRTNRIAVRLT